MKFANTKAFKSVMSRLYGWGAALVILGALFKIMHFPGAGIMLVVGLGTEALIFFFSGFEKPHEELDWTLVYPELAGLEGNGVASRERGGTGVISSASIQQVTLSSNLDKLLEEANIGPELIENLSRGLNNLSNNAAKLADLSNAAIATQGYIKNMENASQSVLELSQSYKNTNEYLRHDISLAQEYGNSLRKVANSMNELSDTYRQTADTAKENLKASEEYNQSIRNISGYTNAMAANYGRNSELLVKTVEALEGQTLEGGRYSQQLQKTARNLEALNAAYELQLQAAEAQIQVTGKLKNVGEQLSENLESTGNYTNKYKDEVEKLTINIAALNSVYGNMLTAMNFNPANR